MKKVKILIEVNGELKKFYLTICSEKELEKVEKLLDKEIANHK